MSKFELEHINTLWFMTLGVTAISAGVLVYVLLLESALGAFSIREFYPVISARDDGPRIAILDSDFTRDLGEHTPEVDKEAVWYDYLIGSWQAYVDSSAYNLSTDFISDEKLEAGELFESHDVLILPASHALSDKQIDEILAFMEAGGNVYASWKTGYYRPDGRVRGWSVIESLFGVEHVADVDRNEGTYRAFQSVFPGKVEPGIYVPINNVLSGIEENDFKPLAGYRWVAPLSVSPPRTDHAQADTSTMMLRDQFGELKAQSGVTVNYYSWLGDASGRKTPYPYVGFGMEQVSFLGNTPLTLKMPAGYGLFVQVYDPAIRMKIIREETRPIAYWTDWVRSLDASSIEDQSSIVYGTYLNGRFVYSGFRRDALGVGHTEMPDIVAIDRFFKNVFNYLRKTPSVWLKDWPAPYSGGAMLSGLGGANLDNLLPIADSLEEQGVRSTFFIEPTQADLHRSTVVSLQSRGEIGVLDDYADRSFDSFSDKEQRFSNLRSVLEEVSEGEVRTYRSSQLGAMQMEMQSALAKAGYTSVFTDSLERRSLPVVSRFTAPRLTRFTATSWTDEEIIAANTSRAISFDPIEKEIERIGDEAGLYQLVYSSEGFGKPAYRYMLPKIVRSLVENRFWIATSTEITQWWRERHGIKVAMDQSGKSRLVLHLSNQNGEVVQQIGVMIDLGQEVESVRIRPELIGSSIPKHELTNNNSLLFIKVVSLKPQQTRLFHIDLIFEDSLPLIAEDASENLLPTASLALR
ncbi:MAG: hypothetical protein AB8G77_15065 [Rhodothermales bacterium]